jgi:hypothetical protein
VISPLTGRGGGRSRRLTGKQNVWSVVDEKLYLAGLKRIPVPADGNCQFHAISVHCHMSHLALRAATAQFLAHHRYLFTFLFRR